MAPGIIGRKIGMTRVFRESGEAVPVTVIQAGPAVVTQVKTRASDGYDAIQLGLVAEEGKRTRINSPEKGHLRGIDRVRHLREFRVDPDSMGDEAARRSDKVDVGFLKAGDTVSIAGSSKGKGFAGVVKRHGFAGGPKTHGQTDRHRAPGSIGATTYPGRVLKGKKMAGHMGHARVKARGLEVVRVDLERNLLLVKGAVPGASGGLLIIEKTR
ncbi:MAG: 50S ribosomal protein L3 [Dehalococcoidia bacterium]